MVLQVLILSNVIFFLFIAKILLYLSKVNIVFVVIR